jgi:P27 family predicted phage terminase small subunit
MMGSSGSGRTPKPTALKLVDGTRECRINRNEPTPSGGEIVAPEGMTEDAKKVWDELAPDLEAKGVLTPWDVYALEAYCEAVAQLRECRTLLQKKSVYGKYVDKGAAGGVIKSPYHQMMNDCIERMNKIGARFGLTPADRSRLSIEGDAPVGKAERFFG